MVKHEMQRDPTGQAMRAELMALPVSALRWRAEAAGMTAAEVLHYLSRISLRTSRLDFSAHLP